MKSNSYIFFFGFLCFWCHKQSCEAQLYFSQWQHVWQWSHKMVMKTCCHQSCHGVRAQRVAPTLWSCWCKQTCCAASHVEVARAIVHLAIRNSCWFYIYHTTHFVYCFRGALPQKFTVKPYVCYAGRILAGLIFTVSP